VTAGSPSAQIISLRVDELRIGLGKAQFRDGDTVFLCRVAGVAVHEGRVLLHRSEHDDFWALPGGRIEVGESSTQALRREMLEEVGAEVTVGRLLWVVENFFQHYPLDQSPDTTISIDHHEIGLYLEMEVPDHMTDVTSFGGRELVGTSDEFALEFRWFDQAGLGDFDVRPSRLEELLTQPLPAGLPTILNHG
jgi:ADP-ribose pyrophosphatase YjhB (NUDIX family)